MSIETVYTTLQNAGFIVKLSGMSFIVSLKNRNVRSMELQQVLNFAENVTYQISGSATIVYVS